jgi:hypothetical protein
MGRGVLAFKQSLMRRKHHSINAWSAPPLDQDTPVRLRDIADLPPFLTIGILSFAGREAGSGMLYRTVSGPYLFTSCIITREIISPQTQSRSLVPRDMLCFATHDPVKGRQRSKSNMLLFSSLLFMTAYQHSGPQRNLERLRAFSCGALSLQTY